MCNCIVLSFFIYIYLKSNELGLIKKNYGEPFKCIFQTPYKFEKL